MGAAIGLERRTVLLSMIPPRTVRADGDPVYVDQFASLKHLRAELDVCRRRRRHDGSRREVVATATKNETATKNAVGRLKTLRQENFVLEHR